MAIIKAKPGRVREPGPDWSRYDLSLLLPQQREHDMGNLACICSHRSCQLVTVLRKVCGELATPDGKHNLVSRNGTGESHGLSVTGFEGSLQGITSLDQRQLSRHWKVAILGIRHGALPVPNPRAV